jgi:hypothetical protein
LRQILSVRFPGQTRKGSLEVSAGTPAIDGLLGGGLPARRLTELVSAAPSSGGQTLLARLLEATRTSRRRMALVDGMDAFDPESVPEDALKHLVWVRIPPRPTAPDTALAAADILVRDGNYAAIVLDLRGLEEKALRKIPASSWYRLQRAAEGGTAAVLVQTCFALVPAAAARLVLPSPLPLARSREPREAVAAALVVESVRPLRSTEAAVA